jgi:hypothetical protein
MLPNTTCNSLTTCPDFFAAGMGDIFEINASDAPVPGRGSGSVLNASAVSWSVANETLGVPAVTVTIANFTLPYASSIPACPQPSTGVTSNVTIAGPGGKVVLQAMVPLQDTNLTVDGQTVEILAGNVKWNARVMNWPFCNSSDSLRISFLMRSANDSSAPANDTSTDLLDAQQQMENRFKMPFNLTYAGNATNTSMMGDGPGFGRRGIGMQGGPAGLGPRGNIPGGSTPFPQRPIDAFNKSMYPPLVLRMLNQTFMHNRPVYGMGQRNLSHPGMFLFFPLNNMTGNATVQAKVDVPSTAIVNGVVTNVTLTSPSAGYGHDHRVDITIPSASSIVYDPTATLSSEFSCFVFSTSVQIFDFLIHCFNPSTVVFKI